MREPDTSHRGAAARTDISRRSFVGRATAGALALAGLGATTAGARTAAAAPDAWWTRAHAIAASGALGTLRWVEARYPSARGTRAAWTPHVDPILAAIGARGEPRRTSALGSGEPTVVLEFEAAPPVFLAPAAGGSQGASVVVRGSRASLLLQDGELWVRPESPRAAPRRI